VLEDQELKCQPEPLVVKVRTLPAPCRCTQGGRGAAYDRAFGIRGLVLQSVCYLGV
jgi:hypothetical protein